MIKILNNGSYLENIITLAIEKYNEKGIAFFRKRNINNFFALNNCYKLNILNYSGCDYIGLYKGKYIIIEAKETKKDIFNINNISKIQKNELEITNKLGGLSLILIFFINYEKYYLIKYDNLIKLKNKNIANIKKNSQEIYLKEYYLDFLKTIDYYL